MYTANVPYTFQFRMNNHSAQNKQSTIAISAFVLGLPLLFVPFYPGLNKSMRWGFLITVAVSCILITGFRHGLIDNFQKLSRWSQAAFIVLVAGAIISTVLATHSLPLRLVGWDTEFLGLSAWLGFFVLALVVRTSLGDFIKSRWALGLGASIVLVSLISNYLLIFYGYRLTGLLQQATSMGMFAALVLVLAIWQVFYIRHDKRYTIASWAIAALAISAVLLSQSRLALAAATMVLLLLGMVQVVEKKKPHIGLLITLVILLVTPVVARSYFSRLDSEVVVEGFSYRADVYRASLTDIAASNYITGYGASGIPGTINSRNKAPDGVAESLDQGFVFLSAHDIYLDIALSFGLAAGLGFVILSLQALHRVIHNLLDQEYVLLSACYLILLLNGIFNVPSLEMTLLLMASTFALLPNQKRFS